MKKGKNNPVDVDSLVGETSTGFDDASALPSRLERYSTARLRTLAMANYIKKAVRNKHFDNVAMVLKDCGSYLCFHDYFTVGKIRLSAASFCNKHLLCPLCAIRRGAKYLKAYLDRLEVVLGDRPGLKPYLVTLTVKNGSDLQERFEHLQDSVAALQVKKRDFARGKGGHYEVCKALGGVGSIEFKRGKGSKLWHPHYHAVWLCEAVPDPVQLSQEWKSVTGDSHVVDVQEFYGEDIVSGFCEVFKYALKFSSMSLRDNLEGFLVLSGRRLVNSFGLFRGVIVPEIGPDDLLDDLPYVERFYHHSRLGYVLARRPQEFVPGEKRSKDLPPVNPVDVLLSRRVSRNRPEGQNGYSSFVGPYPQSISP